MKNNIRSGLDRSDASILSRLIRFGALGALAVSQFQHVVAQDEDDEAIFELSPFEVDASDDVGWQSTNSTSGTSLNTAIKDIPMSIEVINSDFISDIQADDFDEALEYSAGVNLEEFAAGSGNNSSNTVGSAEQSASTQGGIGQRFTNGTSIRGFSVPFQNRLGFRYGGSIASFGVNMGGFIDSVNTGRMEVVRGPNSLLYGIGVLSGIVNVMPKTPLSEPSGAASIGFGSNDYYRRTFEWTAPLVKDLWGGGLNYRVAMAETRRGDETIFEENIDYYVGQLEYRSDKLSVFFEVQKADVIQRGIGSRDLTVALGNAIDADLRDAYYDPYQANEYYSLDGDYWNDKRWFTEGDGYIDSLRGRTDLNDNELTDLEYVDYVAGLEAEIAAIEESGFADLSGTAFTNAANEYERKRRELAQYESDETLYGEMGNYDYYNKLVGSDAYATLDETDVTLDVNFTPIENLSFSVGAFLTGLEEDEFSPSLGVQTGGAFTDNLLSNFLATDSSSYREVQTIKQKLRDGEAIDQEEEELLGFYNQAETWWNDNVTTYETPAYLANDYDPDFLDHRVVAYNWSLSPKDTSTEQYRARVSYQFNTPDFVKDSKAKHNLTAGYSYIHDVAKFIDGDPGYGVVGDTENFHRTGSTVYPTEDAITQIRNITDFTTVDYKDEPTGLDGDYAWNVDVWYRSAYGLYTGNFFNDKLYFLAGYRYDEYFTRTRVYDRFDEYAPFQGYDSYFDWLALDDLYGQEGQPAVLSVPLTDSLAQAALDGVEGTIIYQPRAALMASQGLIWEDSGDRFDYDYRAYTEEGESEYGPGDSYSSETSVTLAMNYDINDDLTLYAVSSGGVTPNIGLLDGNSEPIPSEKTTNLEIGLKFELFDRKLSGSLSVYEITRENAVWDLSNAPRPAFYYGAPSNTDNSDAKTGFNPQSVIDNGILVTSRDEDGVLDPNEFDINYAVHENVFIDATTHALESLFADENSDFAQATFAASAPTFNPYDEDYNERETWSINELIEYEFSEAGTLIGLDTNFADGVYAKSSDSVYLTYNELDNHLVVLNEDSTQQTQIHFSGEEFSYELVEGRTDVHIYNVPYKLRNRDVLEQAWADREREINGASTVGTAINGPEEYQPFLDRNKVETSLDENSSKVARANTTFTDVATGFDMQLVYQPTKSWQMTFSFAHTEREAQGSFNMVDPLFLADDGETYYFGTEYDTFVQLFDRAAYGLEETYLYDDAGEIRLDSNGNKMVDQVLKDGVPVQIGDVLASEATSGIDGLSLYYGIKDSGSIYQKYTFQEGPLKRFSVALGLVYQGPANTSLEFGGTEVQANLYPTPDKPERLYANMNFNYSWKWGNFPMRAALRISNIGNDTYDEAIVEYYNEVEEQVELRRTPVYYAPRTYRFSLSTTF